MNEEITIEHNGKSITASYSVIGDTLKVYLPDGSTRTTELRGLDCENAAELHLKMYLKNA